MVIIIIVIVGCRNNNSFFYNIIGMFVVMMKIPSIISYTNVILGEVYAIGGYNGVKTVDVVEKYNPKEGSWREVAPLVFGRSVPGIAVAYLWPVQSTMRTFWEGESQL